VEKREIQEVSAIFIISGIYDGILGLAFLIYPEFGFDLFNVGYPNHWGYVRFPAALLCVFAVMFFAIAFQPKKNRSLIPYGILLKLSYSLIVFGYWFTKGLPNMWKPFAIADIGFAILFLWSFISLGEKR
jgi:hypothetical protein